MYLDMTKRPHRWSMGHMVVENNEGSRNQIRSSHIGMRNINIYDNMSLGGTSTVYNIHPGTPRIQTISELGKIIPVDIPSHQNPTS
jgi:hypothetical protein